MEPNGATELLAERTVRDWVEKLGAVRTLELLEAAVRLEVGARESLGLQAASPKTSTAAPTCGTCRFSAVNVRGVGVEPKWRWCRRLPPALHREGGEPSLFPLVRASDWCGEHRPR